MVGMRCVKCKGRKQCGRSFCPIIAKSQARFQVKKVLTKENFEGSIPSVFVGHYGYPSVNVGMLGLGEVKDDAWEYDAPNHWSENDYSIDKVINFRSSLINSNFKMNVKQKEKYLEMSQEIGMADKPVNVEIQLKDRPNFRVNVDSTLMPMGPNAKLEKAEITSNPHIPTKVDKIVSDTDLKSANALNVLFEKGFNENYLTKLLSIGNLGVKEQRKLVPTRWSITAVDDTIGKQLIEGIKYNNEMDFRAYFGGYMGNYYVLLFFPDAFSYELFETALPKSSWNPTEYTATMTDYEGYKGRKAYADNTAGGYYAARIAIVEKLNELKKRGSVLALRFVTGEYYCPLGVWVVREATRKALISKPIHFDSKELMFTYTKHLIKKKFGYDVDKLLKESKLLKNMKQRKLTAF